MRDELTKEQIEFYQTNGFLVIEDFLEDRRVGRWRRCTEDPLRIVWGVP